MPPLPAQVNSEGVYRYTTAKWFHRALASLACSGVRGAAVDVWVRIALAPPSPTTTHPNPPIAMGLPHDIIIQCALAVWVQHVGPSGWGVGVGMASEISVIGVPAALWSTLWSRSGAGLGTATLQRPRWILRSHVGAGWDLRDSQLSRLSGWRCRDRRRLQGRGSSL